MVITDRAAAERADVEEIVNKAEIVWFAGGDQCNYIRWIKGRLRVGRDTIPSSPCARE